ncbi:MAG: AI-2E family transporter [Acidobacteria bacterium]|nr:AI-2E family transporter [Acidobacteriota bacterium]
MASIPSTRVQHGFLLLLGAAAVAVSFAILQPFLMPLVAAIALAILFYPLHHRIHGYLRRPGLAAGLSVLLVILLIALPAIGIGSAVLREARQLYDLAANKSAAGGGWAEWTANLLHRSISWAGVESPETEEQIRTALIDRLQAFGGTALAFGRDVLANLVSLILSTIVTLFSLFYLFRDGVRIKNRLAHIMPLAPGAVDRLFTDIGESVLANVYGISAVALTQGGLIALIFYLLGLQSPALWGTIGGFCSMLPIVGPAIVWVPAALILAIGGSWGKAAILVGFGTGVIGLADNFIRPYVISGRVNLHPLLVFFALLGGVEAFGFLGLFIGPATLSVAVAVFELLRADATPAPVSDRTSL